MLKMRENCIILRENLKITQIPGEVASRLGSERESGEFT